MADADNIIECRAYLRPGKFGTVFRDLPFPKRSFKLRCHTGKRSGGGFGQRLKKVLRPVGGVAFCPQRRRVAEFLIGGIPARLMSRKIGFSLRARRRVLRIEIEYFLKRLE
ncbi:hypothetical protein ACWGS9_20890 [Bradyrhizobium sp. Arg314]